MLLFLSLIIREFALCTYFHVLLFFNHMSLLFMLHVSKVSCDVQILCICCIHVDNVYCIIMLIMYIVLLCVCVCAHLHVFSHVNVCVCE